MKTEIVFILDRSGSMAGMESDVIGGFNAFLNEQKKLKDKALLTTILFDTEYEVLHDGVDIQKVEPITKKEYFVRGGTALLDAVGRAISGIKAHYKDGDKVLFVINTDGEENSSHEFTKDKLKKMIEKREKKDNWKFMFLGANIDSFSVASGIGIPMAHTSNFSQTGQGYATMYNAVSNISSNYRGASAATASLVVEEFTNIDKPSDSA
jgi:uncharacterized protein YegL